ncbi:MAG TPA: amino acid transporter, partial [Cyclobacteriaceae bacterium]|nr:amino acid transporter [Cyclobacteriaceae bacterium]
GSHFAGDFFLGIDIMVTSMLVNFLLMCITVVSLPRHNPELAREVKVITNRKVQLVIAISGIVLLTGFLGIHTYKDLTSNVEQWYFHSTPVWIIVMTIASLVYFKERKALEKSGVDTKTLFRQLPEE